MNDPSIHYADDSLADQIHRSLHPRVYTVKSLPGHPGLVSLTDQDGNYVYCTEAIAKKIQEMKP